MFKYPKFTDGKQIVTRVYDKKTADMLQNITVYKIKAGEEIECFEPDMESAYLLLQGEIVFYYNDKEQKAKRDSCFELPTCLHTPKEVAVIIKACTDSEVLVQSTYNDKNFEPKLILSTDVHKFTSCKDKWEGTAEREVIDIINIKTAPYSNMVMGEVFAKQGRWWSYIPHDHPQPEVYYYKFLRPEGFGACFIEDKAYKIKDYSAGMFPGGKTHVQVTAPGYPMYCCWMIRHLDGNPWDNTRTDRPEYSWLLNG